MDIYQTSLLIGACVVALLNYNQPRALLWILVGAADFLWTNFYSFHPYACVWVPYYETACLSYPFMTGMTDATVASVITTYRLYTWERFVAFAFIGSVAISVAYLWGSIPDHTMYVTWLEIANWIALLFMGSVGIVRLIDDFVVGSHPRSVPGAGVRFARCYLDQKRRPTKVPASVLEH
jgi:hypothetical protein